MVSAEAREDASAGRVSFSRKGNPYMGAYGRVLLAVPPPPSPPPTPPPLRSQTHIPRPLCFIYDTSRLWITDDALIHLPWLARENAGVRLAARRRAPLTRTTPAASSTRASAYGTSTRSRTRTLSTYQGRAGLRSCWRRMRVCHTCCACSATSCPSGAAGSYSCRTWPRTFCTLCYLLRHYGTPINPLVC